ncbi:MAG: class I SAM-dependent methyltransferase [bacterium]|nr:class I SAM-dependent methyltransferase [bacterium]
MTDEQACVLSDEQSPYFVGGAFHFTTPSIYNVPRIIDAFRKGGGIPYPEMGGEISHAIERFLMPGYINHLVNDWIPAVPGMKEKLERGARVCDMGCGRGQSTVNMAKAFPKSHFLGVDYDRGSISSAMKLAAEHNVSNTDFRDIPAEKLPRNGTFDLICTFDCIHDMVNPVAALRAIRDALAADGVLLWAEPNASHNAHENRNPLGKAFHAISPLHCMTVSLAYDGAGLGTVIGEKGSRELAQQAGYSHFERLPIDYPFNQFFLLRR